MIDELKAKLNTYILGSVRSNGVVHCFYQSKIKRTSVCCHTSEYLDIQLDIKEHTDKNIVYCEQCLITLATNCNAMFHKFFAGYIPSKVRAKQRKVWKEYKPHFKCK